MLIAEKLALVAFEPETGHPDQLTNANYSGAGIAVLLTAELALRGAVAVVGSSITVAEQRVDDPLLERVRLALAQHPDTDLAQQVRRMSLAIGGAWHEILGRLEQDGLIREVEPRRPPLHRARYDVDRAARDSVLAEIDRAARHGPADAATECLILDLARPEGASQFAHSRGQRRAADERPRRSRRGTRRRAGSGAPVPRRRDDAAASHAHSPPRHPHG